MNSVPSKISAAKALVVKSMSAAVCAGVLAASWSSPVSASAVALASHRAVYDLQLSSADERSGIANIVGRLVTEFSGDTCDGYTLNMRRVMQIGTTDGATNVFDTLTTSWESGTGDEMRFGSRLYINAQLVEDLTGNAERGHDDVEGTALFQTPEESELPLPADAVFPVEHTKEIVNTALEGGVITRSTVFDGGEVDKVYTAVSFVGGRIEAESVSLPENPAIASMLEGLPAWPVTVSYYENTATEVSEQLPAYEVRLIMFESGIAIDLVLVYEGFSLSGTLSDLEVFDPTSCE
jgi:hypothetical protein